MFLILLFSLFVCLFVCLFIWLVFVLLSLQCFHLFVKCPYLSNNLICCEAFQGKLLMLFSFYILGGAVLVFIRLIEIWTSLWPSPVHLLRQVPLLTGFQVPFLLCCLSLFLPYSTSFELWLLNFSCYKARFSLLFTCIYFPMIYFFIVIK